MLSGNGAFAHSTMQILRDNGAEVSCYLTRSNGNFGASSVGKTWMQRDHPSPIPIIRKWKPDVIKNPICSPKSPIQAIVCKSVEDTYEWLNRVDFSEGVFLQEYLGAEEIAHFAFVSNGNIQSIMTHWEYKRAFTGDMGPIAGAPLGSLVEQDLNDKYGLMREFILPLQPWLEKTHFCGILSVSAVKKNKRWYVIEYNVRIGVTINAFILQMLKNPAEVIIAVASGRKIKPSWDYPQKWGCSLTLAGYGYPYPLSVKPPKLPVSLTATLDCDLWWNEVDKTDNGLYTCGPRIAEVASLAKNKQDAVSIVYKNIEKVQCLGSYYRLDIGG